MLPPRDASPIRPLAAAARAVRPRPGVTGDREALPPGSGRVTLTSGPLACRVVLRLGSHHDAGDVAREAFDLTSDVVYLAGMLSTGASIAVRAASSRIVNAPGDKAEGRAPGRGQRRR